MPVSAALSGLARRWATSLGLIVAVCLLGTAAGAQDLEPRTYSASPIGTNFLGANFTRSTGGVSLAPTLPISGVQATINTTSLGYERVFDLLGRTANIGLGLPYTVGNVQGNVGEQSHSVYRSGLGDLRVRFTANLIGGEALTPEEFAKRQPTTTLGASLVIIAPTGDYNSQHLINISSNRWSFRPELGLSHPMGNWFSEIAAGAWVFTDNPNFFNGHVRSQNPLWEFQLHQGYNFRPGLWLAVDGTYYTGGETSVDGNGNQDAVSNARYGVTLSIPLLDGLSVKLNWTDSLVTRLGGTYQTVGASLAYRWFSPVARR